MSYDSGTIFKFISLLSQFGIEIKNLPRIIILGQQNEGKSSLIESLIQVEILPKFDGLCTRKPIYLTLINDTETRIVIEDKPYTESEAAYELNRLNLDPKIERINCIILSPNVYNCTIIDTVGLIHVSEQDSNLDPKKIKQDTIEYLKDKNNIFVLVSAAPSDLANSQMLQLIKKHGRCEDTLGVMTKIDLIENQNQNSIADILSGKNYRLGYGWIPTKLRSDREIYEKLTIEESIIREHNYCQGKRFANFSYGIPEIRRKISNIQFERIKSNIPHIIEEIDMRIKSLQGSQNFLDKIINESDTGLAYKLSMMIEKLVGSSYERSEFENSLKKKLKEFLLDYMDKVFNYTKEPIPVGESDNLSETPYKLENNLSTNYIDPYIYNYHVQNSTVASDLSSLDDINEMLNSGLISVVTLNNENLQKAFNKEIAISTMLPIFELKIDDNLNTKKIAWTKYLEKYFSSLQDSNALQNNVYQITEKMLLEYILSNKDEPKQEISKHFTEYIIHNIGQTAFEEKMRYSISCLVNIEQRPYINIYDVIRQLILITKSPYLDYHQFYTIRRMFNKPNCNKINLMLYSDLWNRIYLMTVIDRLALNCYRIVAVNLVNKMVENLLSMTINLNKDTSQKENDKIIQKIDLLNQVRESLTHLSQC